MADYKRMVSYMYQYENGVKRKNVGFVRVEAKGGQCKITLHMQLLGQLDSIFPTYLIQRKHKDLDLIYLGDTVLKNQVMDSRLLADENNIMGSGYSLSDMGGLLLFLNDKVFFATQWDDKPVVASEVLEALRPKTGRHAVVKKQGSSSNIFRSKENAASKEQAERELEEELKIPTYMLPGGWKMVERLMGPENKKLEPVQSTDNYEEEIRDEIARLNDSQIDEAVQRLIEPDILAANTNQTKASYGQAYDTQGNQAEEKQNYGSQTVERQPDNTSSKVTQQPENTYQKVEHQPDNASQKVAQQPKNAFQKVARQPNNAFKKVAQQVDNNFLKESQKREGISQENVQQINNTAQKDVQTMKDISQNDTQIMDPPTAKNILENYPKIYPFEDNEILQCVKIEPKDIGLLPKEIWPLSNNSFLMHGYYCYHHLIFAKMKNRFGYSYILGIPGIFHGREQFMARMFGFENFKSIKRRELKQGDFGYWYIPIYL